MYVGDVGHYAVPFPKFNILKKNLQETCGQNVTPSSWQFFVDFMGKELCAKFCGVFIIKLQNVEFSITDVTPYPQMYKTC